MYIRIKNVSGNYKITFDLFINMVLIKYYICMNSLLLKSDNCCNYYFVRKLKLCISSKIQAVFCEINHIQMVL